MLGLSGCGGLDSWLGSRLGSLNARVPRKARPQMGVRSNRLEFATPAWVGNCSLIPSANIANYLARVGLCSFPAGLFGARKTAPKTAKLYDQEPLSGVLL